MSGASGSQQQHHHCRRHRWNGGMDLIIDFPNCKTLFGASYCVFFMFGLNDIYSLWKLWFLNT